MNKFKEGDVVKITKACGMNKVGEVYKLHSEDGTLYAGTCFCENNWELINKPMDLTNMVEGTIVKKEDLGFRRVLAVLGGSGETRAYAMSKYDKVLTHNDLKSSGCIFTAFDLSQYDYTIYQQEDTIEVDGKKYRRDDVTERLSELTPINE